MVIRREKGKDYEHSALDKVREEHTVVLEGEKTEVPRGTQDTGGAEKEAKGVAEALGQ